MKVIIAAAGTGGHINPGIAIANKIEEEEPRVADNYLLEQKEDIEKDFSAKGRV